MNKKSPYYLDILFYSKRGLFFAPLVRLQTRGWTSHVSIRFLDGDVMEALPFKGVVRRPYGPEDYAAKIIRVEVSREEYYEIRSWFLSQEGKGYDYWGISRFITRIPHRTNNKWFCSGFIFEGFRQGNIYLLERTKEWEVYPMMLWRITAGYEVKNEMNSV